MSRFDPPWVRHARDVREADDRVPVRPTSAVAPLAAPAAPPVIITIPEDYAPEWETWTQECVEDEDDTPSSGLDPSPVFTVPDGAGDDDPLGDVVVVVPPRPDPGPLGLPNRADDPSATLVDAPVKTIELPEVLPIGQHRYEYLCGTAGTGKSTMARALIERTPGVVLAATTGIAAVNLGEGTTINALLKYFDIHDLREKYTTGQVHTSLRRLWRAGLRRIVLDEVSMLSADALTYITRAIEETNAQPEDSELAAIGTDDVGGDEPASSGRPKISDDPIGITLVGDFGQLPPVPDSEEYRDTKGEKQWRKLPVRFAFESPEWPRYAAHVVKLTKIWRQDAQDFVRGLHAVRKADKAAAMQFFTEARFDLATDDTFDGTTIFAKNDDVDRYNQLRLDKLTTTPRSYNSSREGAQRPDWKNIPAVCIAKDTALVMILANRRLYEDEEDEHGRLIYANGDLAHIEGVDQYGAWRGRLKRTGQVVNIVPVTRENVIPLEPGRKKELKELYPDNWTRFLTEDQKYEVIGRITYMPVRVAYGCTVHKTQGLTLDAVQVNIRDWMFKTPGMLFVALSRARTAEGLRIIGNQRGFLERCTVDARVVPWL